MTEFTTLMVFLLMPGILGVLILDSLIEHKPWSPFLYTVYAIVFGVAVYMVEEGLFWIGQTIVFQFQAGSPAYSSLGVWSNISGRGAEFNLLELVFGAALAVPLAALFSFIVHKKHVNKVAKCVGVSTKYGDENLFSYFLNSDEVLWVYVRDAENDLTYQGMIEYCSETDDLQELVLREVTVYSYADSEMLYSRPRVYISKKHGHLAIEVIPSEKLERKERKNAETTD